jgi:hypothetical protein
MYSPNGALGACGTNLDNESMVAAIADDTWGASTYDYMTGASSNKWCGQRVRVSLDGRFVDVTIMDMCPGCKGKDIDLSDKAWRELTNGELPGRKQATWSML